MLKAENLTLNVDDEGGKKCLLNNISFQVEDGEMLVITGPNGGGKSTLAKTLIGIQTPDSGKIILDGQDITELDINHRANAGIGFAFQQPPRFKGMTVMKLLKLAAKDELSDKECCDLLTAVGLCAKDYIYRQIDGTLSGGEMKRIEIASVLAKEHSLCIFDEPEAGIDLWSFSMLIQKFEEIHTEKKQSLIVISHQEKIINMADRIMIIDGGEIKKIGTNDEVLPYLNGVQKCHKCVERLDGKTYQGNVAKFNWPEGSSNEYYLAACEWRDKLLDISPKDYGDRVLMHGANELMYISARVFQRVAGESGDDVKYILNEDVRAQMEEHRAASC